MNQRWSYTPGGSRTPEEAAKNPVGFGYTAGELRVPFFSACPDMRQIVRPNGSVLGTVSVDQLDAFLSELNSLLGAPK